MTDERFVEAVSLVMMLLALPMFLAVFLTACLLVAPVLVPLWLWTEWRGRAVQRC